MIYGIITDIHEDIESLRKVLYEISNLKIDEIVCLGDIVGVSLPYHKSFFNTRSANECLDLIKKSAVSVVGNHDLNAILKTPNNSIFKYPKDWYKLTIKKKKVISKNRIHLYKDEVPSSIKEKNRNYIENLQESLVIDKTLFSHFLYPNLTGSDKLIGKEIEIIRQHFQFMLDNNLNVSFIGHLHNRNPRVISTKEIIDISVETEYFLSEEELYIVMCPPIVRLSTLIEPSFMIFDSQKKSLQWLENKE